MSRTDQNRIDMARFRRIFQGKIMGTITEVIRPLPDEMISWLSDQIPPDAKLADVIRAIVWDAYLDEQGKPKNSK
ncbi:hypothetical protein UFOVP16_12 [uncultured Caudovirales phage]|uniref:Uncharacterized protein n=1 Tax=uncultured Caudovirales phage TaxID=2100421 RepID=A0A6J5KL40_9CAUD|nr:hypothetical protein UFOVP16_12 [uncultured Caudovirales phage]